MHIYYFMITLMVVGVKATGESIFLSRATQFESILVGALNPFYRKTSVVFSGQLKDIVRFYLFTRSNPNDPDLIYIGDDVSLAQSHFDASKPVRLYSHGWQGDFRMLGSVPVRKAYLEAGDYNIIILDWSPWSKLGYAVARAHVPIVGAYIGRMINYLESKGASMNDMIVTGHSFGAHIAGIAAKRANNIVGHVVGLDPSRVLFRATGNEGKITRNDAKFVEIIHSNDGGHGYPGLHGHVDFFPNGGSVQPGCEWDLTGTCSHLRAVDLFAESIRNPGDFVARACTSYSSYENGACRSNDTTFMCGDLLDEDASGSYYFDTRSSPPYAINSID